MCRLNYFEFFIVFRLDRVEGREFKTLYRRIFVLDGMRSLFTLVKFKRLFMFKSSGLVKPKSVCVFYV